MVQLDQLLRGCDRGRRRAERRLAGEHLKPYGFQYVQLDDGYDRGPKKGTTGSSTGTNRSSPRAAVDRGLHQIKRPARRVVAGSQCLRRSGRSPPRLVPARQAGQDRARLRHAGAGLESSRGSRFLKRLFQPWDDWGFEYYKFDGEHALPKYAPPVDLTRLHDPTADPLAVYRHRLEVIRQVVGPNTFIEGCPAGTPLNGIGFFNSYFNGHDLYNNWHGMYALFSSINANAFLNHVVVYVMPGEGLELGVPISVEEAESKSGRRKLWRLRERAKTQ